MKTQIKMNNIKTNTTIKIQMLAGKTAEIRFSDAKQAREYFEYLRNIGVLAGEAIRIIDIE